MTFVMIIILTFVRMQFPFAAEESFAGLALPALFQTVSPPGRQDPKSLKPVNNKTAPVFLKIGSVSLILL